MAQPGVAREPSMEEILASIRRIIESNEPDAVQAAGGTMPAFDISDDDEEAPADEPEDIHLTIEDELPDFSAVASPREQRAQSPALQAAAAPRPIPQAALQNLQPAPQAAVAQGTVPASVPESRERRDIEQRSISLADVAARVRAASERSPSEMLRNLASPEPVQQSRPVELRPAASSVRGEPVARVEEPMSAPRAVVEAEPRIPPTPRAEASAHQPVSATPRSAEAEMASLAANDRSIETVRPVAEAAQPLRRIDPVQPGQGLALSDEARPLVSDATGLQVARSFDELAEMVQSTAKRSLDEVAEDLLRPMLQEWLDDNLPTLVERLVREEIERVARGPRR